MNNINLTHKMKKKMINQLNRNKFIVLLYKVMEFYNKLSPKDKTNLFHIILKDEDIKINKHTKVINCPLCDTIFINQSLLSCDECGNKYCRKCEKYRFDKKRCHCDISTFCSEECLSKKKLSLTCSQCQIFACRCIGNTCGDCDKFFCYRCTSRDFLDTFEPSCNNCIKKQSTPRVANIYS